VNLTEKQKRFCDYYIEFGNATKSAIMAGYSEKTARQIADENLTKPYIKNYISERLSAKEDERIASQDEVLRYLTSVLRGEIEEECVVVEGNGEGCSRATTIRKEVTPKDRNKAAELLGKRYGIWKENIDLSGELKIKINLEDDEDE
jgi:phage terminase small subunit